MIPTTVPQVAKEEHPQLQVINIGPPRGVSAQDCGTVEAQVGQWREVGVFDGAPVVRTYWKPSEEELDYLQNHGGVIELTYFSDRMMVTSMNVEKGN